MTTFIWAYIVFANIRKFALNLILSKIISLTLSFKKLNHMDHLDYLILRIIFLSFYNYNFHDGKEISFEIYNL